MRWRSEPATTGRSQRIPSPGPRTVGRSMLGAPSDRSASRKMHTERPVPLRAFALRSGHAEVAGLHARRHLPVRRTPRGSRPPIATGRRPGQHSSHSIGLEARRPTPAPVDRASPIDHLGPVRQPRPSAQPRSQPAAPGAQPLERTTRPTSATPAELFRPRVSRDALDTRSARTRDGWPGGPATRRRSRSEGRQQRRRGEDGESATRPRGQVPEPHLQPRAERTSLRRPVIGRPTGPRDRGRTGRAPSDLTAREAAQRRGPPPVGIGMG